jgi:DNA excision repair protein ERCC-3
MSLSGKGQCCLVDQGYSFKVVARLDGMEKLRGLKFVIAEERQELFGQVQKKVEGKRFQSMLKKENATLLANNMFYGKDSKPLRKAGREMAGLIGAGGRPPVTRKKLPKNKFPKKNSKEKTRSIGRIHATGRISGV